MDKGNGGAAMSVNLGVIDQIPAGQGRCFIINGQEIAVFRSRTGKIWAVSNRCPHRQGPLSEGVMGEGKVVCPLHGHKFDLATGQGSEPHECVATYPIRAENGHLILEPAHGRS